MVFAKDTVTHLVKTAPCTAFNYAGKDAAHGLEVYACTHNLLAVA